MKARIFSSTVTTLILFSITAYCAEPAGPYGAVVVEHNLMIPMRDGVRLATDIYRPAEDGQPASERLPLLLQRTPYDKTSTRFVEQAEYFARHGYVVALQDHRGLFDSEGEFTKYIGEGADGHDTVEYLARLPYVDGQVGMWGTSYAAHAQANAAKLKPAGLRAMLLNMGGMSNGWDHKVRNHGAFEIQQLTWAFANLANETDDPVIRALLDEDTVAEWLTAMPIRKGLNPLSVAPNFEDYVLTMLTHGDYDDYFKHPDVNWVEYYDQTADVPMLLISGWYDSYAGGTVQNYAGLRRELDSPVQLIMGPWTHGQNTRSYAGNVAFGPDAAIPDFHREFHLRWFDHYLKDKAGDRNDDDVRVFVMGTGDGSRDGDGRLMHGGYWRQASEWPLPDTEFQPFYLHADGSLRSTPPGTDVAPTVYTYNPDEPVPTIGGAFSSTGPVFDPGAYDQRERADLFGAEPPYLPLKSRHDVAVFQTEPLTEDVEVVGPIVVRLFVASTAIDTDFTAKLLDVYPPSGQFPTGYEMNLTDGILRMRYRQRPDRQVFMEPGAIYDIEITPFPTANRFKRGHRIRIDISSSNFPRFDVNPNTGEPLGRHRRRVAADNSIYHDARHPSQVILPIVPVD